MKKYILLLVATAFLFAVNVEAGMGNYSNGWRVGQISKFSIKGIMKKSGEGEMLLGRESTPWIIRTVTKDSKGNKTVTKKQMNPWQFSSTNKKWWDKLDEYNGEYAVIAYKESHIRNAFTADTAYEVMGVYPLSDPLPSGFTCKAKTFIDGSKSRGKRTGRIVKASEKGTMVNSFEILMQQGNAGGQFHAMSISKDEALYKCAIKILKSGQKVKIEYDESIINTEVTQRETAYDIVTITVPKGM